MPTSHPVNYCAVTTVAKYFNLTSRRVQQLAREGIIPKPENGQYHLLKCFVGYVRYLQSNRHDKDGGSSANERKQLLQLQCEKLALEIKSSNREVLPADQVVSIWSHMLLKLRSKILALPYRSASLVVNQSKLGDIEKIIKVLVHEALIELSEFDPAELEASKAEASDSKKAVITETADANTDAEGLEDE